MCALAFAILGAIADCPSGTARRALLGSSVPASCAFLLRQPELRGADAAHATRLREGAASVLLRLCGGSFGAGAKALGRLRPALPAATLLDRLVTTCDHAPDLAPPSAEGVLLFSLLHALHGKPCGKPKVGRRGAHRDEIASRWPSVPLACAAGFMARSRHTTPHHAVRAHTTPQARRSGIGTATAARVGAPSRERDQVDREACLL